MYEFEICAGYADLRRTMEKINSEGCEIVSVVDTAGAVLVFFFKPMGVEK